MNMKPVAYHTDRAPGFTLVEILLAVVVFAIVLAAINTVFYGALRLRNKAAQTIAKAFPLNQALQVMQRDLANLVLPGGRLSGQLQTSLSTVSGGTLGSAFSSLSSTTIRNGQQVSPDFYTSTGILENNAPWGDIQEVSYWLSAPTNQTDGMNLIRVVTRNLLATTQVIPTQQRLLSGVKDVTFSYYDGTQWQDTWDSTTSSNLPTAIQVQIQLVPEQNSKQSQTANLNTLPAPIVLVVPIDVQAATNQTAQTNEDLQ